MSGYRPPYTTKEEKQILRYILDEEAHYRLRGDGFWKELQEAGIVERTWQSLKQHFRKKMIFNLHSKLYGLTDDEQYALKRAFAETKVTTTVIAVESDESDSEGSPSARTSSRNTMCATPSKSKKPTTKAQNKNEEAQKAQNKDKEVDFFTMKFSDDEDDDS